MHIMWIKAFNSHSIYGSMGNASLSQCSCKNDIRCAFISRRTGSKCHVMYVETRSRVIRLSSGNVARIGHFLPANNSFVLLSRVIVFVHIIIFCVLDRVYILFRF